MVLFSDLLKSRLLCISISGTVALHLTLVLADLPSWPCPMRYGLGIPCPGCGLSRALKAFISGDWQRSLTIHAFAPVLAGAIALVLGAAFLPSRYRVQFIQYWEIIDRRIQLTPLLVSLFILYWLIRLLFFHKELYELVM